MISDSQEEHRPGIGIDYRGGSVIDPTKNVEDLVRALEAKLAELRKTDREYIDLRFLSIENLQKSIREADERFQNFAREAEAKYATAIAGSETKRLDELAQVRQGYLDTIRDMLAESVKSTSTLVGSQLIQIQSTFDGRVTKLEAAQLTQAGRSSVADPAMETALARITGTMTALTTQLTAMQSSESAAGGQRRGSMDTNARLLAVVMAVAAVASPIIAVVLTIMAMKGK